ncbi:hypothetical protein HGH92_08100 [Chitinophaga varians]|uniref:Uncharacterized protein n=1 Tax=Chitinophaga varians TaxID=2202339 RepID=A0A847RTS7_9BACT|nr:hypothetical protein [Chitinophaga varians]NLR64265.1 hypothetical protein [Chitinophaga varians]
MSNSGTKVSKIIKKTRFFRKKGRPIQASNHHSAKHPDSPGKLYRAKRIKSSQNQDIPRPEGIKPIVEPQVPGHKTAEIGNSGTKMSKTAQKTTFFRKI